MKDIYCTIWSRDIFFNYWTVERTHTIEYAKIQLGVDAGVKKTIGHRIYCIFPEDFNPNNNKFSKKSILEQIYEKDSSKLKYDSN